MNRRIQIRLLIGLLVALALVAYVDMRPAAVTVRKPPPTENFDLLQVESPSLRVDLLERLKQLKYPGSYRNIFSASLPPPPVAVAQKPPSVAPAPPPPPSGPPPLVVPAQFFGYVTDARTGVRRAFFNQDEDVYVLGVGELLVGRFRLVQIGDSTAELEETATGRRATLPMEAEPAQPGQNQVSFPQGPTGVGSSPLGFQPAPFGQNPVSFQQMANGVGPTPANPFLGGAPAVMNPPR